MQIAIEKPIFALKSPVLKDNILLGYGGGAVTTCRTNLTFQSRCFVLSNGFARAENNRC